MSEETQASSTAARADTRLVLLVRREGPHDAPLAAGDQAAAGARGYGSWRVPSLSRARRRGHRRERAGDLVAGVGLFDVDQRLANGSAVRAAPQAAGR
jgi:hypothetical protein